MPLWKYNCVATRIVGYVREYRDIVFRYRMFNQDGSVYILAMDLLFRSCNEVCYDKLDVTQVMTCVYLNVKSAFPYKW